MVVVAVAGGTGGVGRTIVDAIVDAGDHQVIILSRTSGTLSASTPQRRAVNYNNVEHLTQILIDNNVEIVISALLLSDTTVAQAQTNLIRAAAHSGTVTRFIPSEYYIDFHKPIPGSTHLTTLQLAAESELARHSHITYTLLRCGIFLDHLCMPHNPISTYITPFYCFVDLDAQQIVVPGTGDYPVVLSHSRDVARYVEKLLSLPAEKWPRETLVASNTLRVRDLLDIVERATGTKFDVTYDSVEDVRAGWISQLPSNKAVFEGAEKGDSFREVERQVMLSMLSGAHDLPGRELAEMFPDVERTEIEGFLREGWRVKMGRGER